MAKIQRHPSHLSLWSAYTRHHVRRFWDTTRYFLFGFRCLALGHSWIRSISTSTEALNSTNLPEQKPYSGPPPPISHFQVTYDTCYGSPSRLEFSVQAFSFLFGENVKSGALWAFRVNFSIVIPGVKIQLDAPCCSFLAFSSMVIHLVVRNNIGTVIGSIFSENSYSGSTSGICLPS